MSKGSVFYNAGYQGGVFFSKVPNNFAPLQFFENNFQTPYVFPKIFQTPNFTVGKINIGMTRDFGSNRNAYFTVIKLDKSIQKQICNNIVFLSTKYIWVCSLYNVDRVA